MAYASSSLEKNPTVGESTPSWEHLPPDVLRLIFRLFPLRPRLYCVSVACKRWRSVALRLVKAAVMPRHPNEEALMFQRLPSITDLRASRDRLPNSNTAIKTLRLVQSAASNSLIKLDSSIRYPLLKFFSFVGPSRQLLLVLSLLATRAATGITALHISLPHSAYGQEPQLPDKKLTTLHFPHLVDFSFDVRDNSSTTLRALGAHLLRQSASRLTSLNLSYFAEDMTNTKGISLPVFPRLTSLNLGSYSYRTDGYRNQLQNFPLLTELEGDVHFALYAHREGLVHILPAFRTITINGSLGTDYPFADFTNLRELRIVSLASDSSLAFVEKAKSGHLLTELHFFFTETTYAFMLAPYTNLTHLTLSLSMPARKWVAFPKLPKLRSLMFVNGHSWELTEESILTFLSEMVSWSAPDGMQSVTFEFPLPQNSQVRDLLRVFLRYLRQREVGRVVWRVHRIDAEGEALLRECSDHWTQMVHASN